jgi:hypothetical protein
MAQFTPNDVNTSWGFFGTLEDFGNISKTQVMQVYNQLVDMLGDDPDKARQYLDSSAGRIFVDGLTWLVDKDTASMDDILRVLERSKTDRNTRQFWSRYAKFQKYESGVKEPADLVEKLLQENISDFVEELRTACIRTGVGKVIGSETMVPEQVSLVTIALKTGEEITVHIASLPDGTFDFMKMDDNGDFGSAVPFKDVADFFSKIP